MGSLLVLALALVLACPGTSARAAEPAILVVSQGAALLSAVTADGQTTNRLALDPSPAGITADGAGRWAYVSHPELGRITVVDLASWRVARSIALGGQPFGLALTDDGRLLATDWSADRLAVVTLASGRVEHIPVGQSPSAIVLDRAWARGPGPGFGPGLAYVVNRESNDLSVVDLGRLVVVARIPVGRAPFAAALSPDGAWLYVANVQGGDLSVVDTMARKEVGRVDLGGMPYGVAVDPTGDRVFVTDQQIGRLSIIDRQTLTVSGTLAVGEYPEGVVFLPGTLPGPGLAVVANWFSDSLSILDFETGAARLVPVGAGPRMMTAVFPISE
ncbi:YncE family protein [Rhodospirillum sp. A1_3_36]|uniref:YncE family protein n=1 Tax=Rhodospirillum sp. A1_3_36 TaxID=3391666 RepID=UPI0039A6F50F